MWPPLRQMPVLARQRSNCGCVSKDQPVSLCRSRRIRILQQVPIHVQRDLDIGMSHLNLHVLYVFSLLNLQGPEGMPQVVETELPNTGSLYPYALSSVRRLFFRTAPVPLITQHGSS